MKKFFVKILLAISLTVSSTHARADMFGGDVVVLGQILIQTIQQLLQLKELVSNARDEIEFVKNINEGINDSIQLITEIDPKFDAGILKDWRNLSSSIKNMGKLYGVDRKSKNKDVFALNDQTIAETIVFNNEAFSNAKKINRLARQIKRSSRGASPGGAQKLTAQSMGVLLDVQNESLKAQAKGLKIQAHGLARDNQKDKEKAKQMVKAVEDIVDALKKEKDRKKFNIPRI